MPSNEHELSVDLFREQPGLATGLLYEAAGLDLTEYVGIREHTGAFADMNPAIFGADTVFVVSDNTRDQMAVIVEVQRSNEKRKRWVWLAYVANLRRN